MNMGKGKVVAIIGAAVGIASVLLGLAMPALFSWYRIEISGGGYTFGLYLTAFGGFIEDGMTAPTDEIVMLVLIGGILVLAGAGLCITGALTEQKVLGIIGGIAMIVGPTLLIFDLIGQMSEFAEFMDLMSGYYGKNIFFAVYSPYPGVSLMWGVWIGLFIAYAGGFIGLIGGATV